MKPAYPLRRLMVCLALPWFAAASVQASQPQSPVDAGLTVDNTLPPTELSLELAVGRAQQDDPWLTGNRHQQQAMEADAIAAGQLPDPRLAVNLANLPVDSFEFNQEPMTQLQVMLSQQFPRGDSLALKQQQLVQQAMANPYLRAERREAVRLKVTELWLELYRADKTIALIEADRPLFEQLLAITESRYQSALGRVRQQELVRAELELTRLDDRLTMLRQQADTQRRLLGEWLPRTWLDGPLPPALPALQPTAELTPDDWQRQARLLGAHPKVQALEQQIHAAETGTELARQSYRPAWGLQAGYGIRQDADNGMERPDFFSVGVSVDLPLFTDKRQDKSVQAATLRAESVKEQRLLLMRQLAASLEKEQQQLLRQQQRIDLYRQTLLPQMHQQSEASLSAYTADDGDFAEVMRAYIAELGARTELLSLNVARQQTVSRINYLLAGSTMESEQ